jgi:outer membrane immunogenic protein
MKNFVIGVALALSALVATPVMASDFSGPRVEVTAGADDVTRGVDPTDVTYGIGAGYDLQFGKVVAGVEAGVDNVLDRRDIAVGARLGYVLNENVLVFTKVGYSNFKPTNRLTLEGVRVGGGLEVNVVGNVYTKVEYRYTDFEGTTGKHGGLVGVGYRF